MTARKVLLIVRRRWQLLLIAALIGLILGAGLSALRNQGIEPRFEATASVVFARQSEDNTGRLLAAQLSQFQISAIRVNQAVLDSGDADISTNSGETEGFLLFSAVAPTREQATEIAVSMRSAYLDAAPVGVQAVEQDLADLAGAIDGIRREVAELSAEDEVDAETELAGAFLEAAINQLRSEAVVLAVDLILFDLRDDGTRVRSEIESELEAAEAAMADLKAQYNSLGLDPVAETDRDLRMLALNQQESLLTQQYLELFLNQAEVASLTSVGTTTITEVSQTPVSPRVAGLGGAVLAALIGLGALLVYDFVRGPVWSVADLDGIPVLGTLSPRDADLVQRQFPWYMHGGSDRRLHDVQKARAVLQSSIGEEPAAVAVVGVGAPSDEVKASVADLGASLTAVGTEVLIIDAEFGSLSGLPEYGPLHPTLSDLLRASVESADGRQEVKKRLADLVPSMPRLRGMSAGFVSGHPADILASPAFRTVLEECREIADVIMAAGIDSGDSSAAALLASMDRVILVAKAESTRLQDIEETVGDLRSHRASLVGVLLLDARHGPFGLKSVERWLRSMRSRGTRRLRKSVDQ